MTHCLCVLRVGKLYAIIWRVYAYRSRICSADCVDLEVKRQASSTENWHNVFECIFITQHLLICFCTSDTTTKKTPPESSASNAHIARTRVRLKDATAGTPLDVWLCMYFLIGWLTWTFNSECLFCGYIQNIYSRVSVDLAVGGTRVRENSAWRSDRPRSAAVWSPLCAAHATLH